MRVRAWRPWCPAAIDQKPAPRSTAPAGARSPERRFRAIALAPDGRQDHRQRCARNHPERRTLWGGDMLNKSRLSVLASSLLCCTSRPASQQARPNFPDGPGKDTVVAVCGGCHDINRAARRLHAGRLEHAPAHDAELRRAGAAGAVADRHRLSDEELPRAAAAARPRSCRVRCRRRSRSGRCRRSARVRTIRSRPRTARSGGPGSSPTSSAGSIPRPARSGNTRSRRRTPGRTAWSRTRTATSGSPATIVG